jgi:hypothetical protein
LSLNEFIYNMMLKLNPQVFSKIYKSDTFEFAIQLNSTLDYYRNINRSVPFFIKNKDAFWKLPKTIFNRTQGLASFKHSLVLKMMKYNFDVYQFETKRGAIPETNVSYIGFYTLGIKKVVMNFDNFTYVEFVEPFAKSKAYDYEQLRCMSWNESKSFFNDDKTCSFTLQVA